MSRVEIAAQGWGVAQDVSGNAQPSRTVTISGTVYTAQTGGSVISPVVTNADGTIPGWIEQGTYALTIGATSRTVEAIATLLGDSVHSYGAVGDGVADDTTAFQNAMNATSTAGGGIVRGRSGATYLLGQLTPKSDVTLWLYGCTIKLKSSSTFGIFFLNTGSVSNFRIRGGTYAGTGAETTFQSVFQISGASGSGVEVRDITVTNWATAPLYFGNCTRAKAVGNTLINVCTAAGTNAINFVLQGSMPTTASTSLWATDNHIEGCQAHGIAIVETGGSDTTPLRAIISRNNVTCAGSGCPIAIEYSTTTTRQGSRVIIAKNHATYTGTSDVAGIEVAGYTGTDPLLISRVIVAQNTVDSTKRGIEVTAGDSLVTDNQISTSGTYGILAKGHGTIAATGDTTNTSATVANVAGGGSIVNGTIITGTGIPAGTFLVSGAGTATWTLSQAATATNTGVTLTAQLQIRNVEIRGNLIHATSAITQPLIYAWALRDSAITGNRLVTDPGAAGAVDALGTQYCGWLDILDNRIWYAPARGIYFQQGNDFLIARNRVYNPNESSTASIPGIFANFVSGTLYRIADNIVTDDRAAHRMTWAIAISGNPTGTGELLRNEMLGSASAPTLGTFLERSGNRLSTGAMSGRAVLVTGTVTVSTAEIQSSDNVILSVNVPGGTRGEIQLGTIVAGTSFVINSIQPGTASTVQTLDTSTVFWKIEH